MSSPIIWGASGAQSLQLGGLQLPAATSGSLTFVPAATTTPYTLTFPSAQGSSSTVLTNDGSGGLSWAANGSSLYAVSSITGTTSIGTSRQMYVASASGGSFTATLPTAIGNTGLEVVITRTDQTLANAVTLATTSSQTIGSFGTSVTLATRGETWHVISDGANWQVVDHQYPRVWTSYTPTYSAGFGTVTTSEVFWKRDGDSILIKGNFTTGTVAASTCTMTVPSGLAINTAKISATSFITPFGVGRRMVGSNGDLTVGPSNLETVFMYNGSTTAMQYSRVISSNVFGSENGSTFLNSTERQVFDILTVPITGWNG